MKMLTGTLVQQRIQTLENLGLTNRQILEGLEHRISLRTLQRYKQGGRPINQNIVPAMDRLIERLTKTPFI